MPRGKGALALHTRPIALSPYRPIALSSSLVRFSLRKHDVLLHHRVVLVVVGGGVGRLVVVVVVGGGGGVMAAAAAVEGQW